MTVMMMIVFMILFPRWRGIPNRSVHFRRFDNHQVPASWPKFPQIFPEAGGGVWPYLESSWHAPNVSPPIWHSQTLPWRCAHSCACPEGWSCAHQLTFGGVSSGTHTPQTLQSQWQMSTLVVNLCILSVQSLLGPDWNHHTLLVLTHVDKLKEAGLQPSVFLRQASDRLRELSDLVRGGVHFIDNSCDWPLVRGRQLRDQLLHLSAGNHHTSLAVRTDISLWWLHFWHFYFW